MLRCRYLDTISDEDTRLRDSGLEADILKKILQDTSISEMCVEATTLQSLRLSTHRHLSRFLQAPLEIYRYEYSYAIRQGATICRQEQKLNATTNGVG